MRLVDLNEIKPSIDEILDMAKSDAVIIKGSDGVQYILEEADEFEREVAVLGRSEKFMSFLKKRSEEKGGRPLSEFIKELNIL
ncbi:MAG: hypothetical protein BWK80_57420 [Desulfobacteraceae bacterium IS3]|nr:MAG: hypothetical protein BWK80_57420 [Desulfobacteraceae bacterium IS3]